jgi:hypothetical protein
MDVLVCFSALPNPRLKLAGGDDSIGLSVW